MWERLFTSGFTNNLINFELNEKLIRWVLKNQAEKEEERNIKH